MDAEQFEQQVLAEQQQEQQQQEQPAATAQLDEPAATQEASDEAKPEAEAPKPAPKPIMKRGRGAFKTQMKADTMKTESNKPEAPKIGAVAGELLQRHLASGDADGEQERFPRRTTSPTREEQVSIGTVREQLFRKERRRHRVLLIGSHGQLMICQPTLKNHHMRTSKFGKKQAKKLFIGPQVEPPEERPEPEMEQALMALIRQGADAPLSNAVVAYSNYQKCADAMSKELADLVALDDLKEQNCRLRLDFGEMFVVSSNRIHKLCLGELIQRANDSLLEIHMLKDVPIGILRAVDTVNTKRKVRQLDMNFVHITMVIESQEKQSNFIVRGAWEPGEGQFRLLTIENAGISFTWSCFALPNAKMSGSAEAVSCCLTYRSFNAVKARHHPIQEFAQDVMARLSKIEYQRQRHRTASYDGLFDECENFEFSLLSVEVEDGQSWVIDEMPGLVIVASDNTLLEQLSNREQSRRSAAKFRKDSTGTEEGKPRSDHRVIRSRTCAFKWNETSPADTVATVKNGIELLEAVASEATNINEIEAELKLSGGGGVKPVPI